MALKFEYDHPRCSTEGRLPVPTRLSVTKQWQTATKRIVVCCGCVGLSFLAIVGFGLLQRMQAAENTLPARQVSTASTKIQPKLVASYGKLPLSFEANQGQAPVPVKFLSHGRGYTVYLTADEAVLALRKSQPGMRRFGKLGFPGRLDPLGPVEPRPGRWPSRADDWKSLWRSLIPDLSQLVPEPDAGRGSVAGGPESQPPQVMRMRLLGGNAKGRVVGLDELPGRSNYFIGNDPKKWRTNVATYRRVAYKHVYPGIDLVYYGNQRQLEYDFVVAAGADPNAIRFELVGEGSALPQAAGGRPYQIDPSGDLVMALEGGAVRFRKPVVYQPPAPVSSSWSATRHSKFTIQNSELIDGRYVLTATNEIRFEVPTYDRKRPLIIDPVLSYSTFLGGSGLDGGADIALDTAGNIYLTGETYSTDFPTDDPLQGACGGCSHGGVTVFVAKLNPAGSALVYSTYLGGSRGDVGGGIAVDTWGHAYVTGVTDSLDFPTFKPFQARCGSCGQYTENAFVAKLSYAGNALVYSTYLGGNGQDSGSAIAVDAAGNAYVTGMTTSSNFPLANPLQPNFTDGGYDAFVAKLNPAGSALVYSTYLGGSDNDWASGIALDGAGNVYVAGSTESHDFPTANPLQSACGGFFCFDAFVAKLNPAGSALVYSTYLGGSDVDYGSGIAVDGAGNAYVTGATCSTDFPTNNPFQPSFDGGNYDVYVAKLNPAGDTLVYSTYLGGSGDDEAFAIAVDAAGHAYVTGLTSSTDFPTANPFQGTCDDNCSSGQTVDAFVAELGPSGNALVYSTYLGGSNGDAGSRIAVDKAGNAYVVGSTGSPDFPTVNAFQGTCDVCSGRSDDAFVAKISPSVVSLSPASLTFGTLTVGVTSAPQTETVTNTGPANLTISTVTIGGTNASDFATSADTCTGATLTPNSTCAVSVTFTPSNWGNRDALLIFTDDASDSPQTLVLKGTGVAKVGVASVSPLSLTFAIQPLGTESLSQPVTLSNPGPTALTIASIAISANFGQTNNCGASVAANGSCTMNVTFSPTATGTLAGALTITDNSDGVAGSTQTVSLRGTGIAPSVSLSTARVSFGSQPVGTTSAASAVTVTNSGTAGLAFTSIAVTGDFAIAASGTTCNTWTSVAGSGSSCVINVTFTPTATGSRSGSLTLTDNASGSPQVVALSGNGGVPSVSLSTTSVSFGNQPLGTTSAASAVTLTNTGTASLTFTSIGVTGDFAIAVSGTTCSTSAPVAASSNCVINVTLTPTATGSRSGSLTLTDNASGSPQTVSLSGTGTAPLVSLSAPGLGFGNQTVSTTSAAQAETVTNTGTANLTISTVTMGGTNASDFATSADTCTGATIAPNNACTVSVTFTPSGTGSRSASLNFTDNASNSPQTVALSGSGTAPLVSLSAPGLSFGNQPTSTTSAAQAETVTNTGTANLTISTVTLGGTNASDFAKSADTCTGATIAPNGTCTVSVTFTPSAIGSRSASLNFTDNASGSPQTVNLTGTGVATAPVAGVSPGSLTFSNQSVGTTSASQPVTLSNAGNAALTITSIAASANFGATNNCGTSVAASGSCTINVTIAPTAAGPLTGALTITDNSNGVAGSTQSVALSGTGQGFTFIESSGSSASATVAPGQTATYTLLSVAGEGGFNQSVSFACTGAPSEATCTVSPNPVTAGSSATNVTVTVTTTAPSVSAPRSRPLPPVPPLSPGLRGLLMLALALVAMAWAIGRRNQPGVSRWRFTMVPLASGLLLALALAGCGGGGSSVSTPPNLGTPAGTYTLTVTGTAGSGSSALSHSVTLTLNVS
jgi:hypothetical protein